MYPRHVRYVWSRLGRHPPTPKKGDTCALLKGVDMTAVCVEVQQQQ